MKKDISIIIPACQEEKTIESCLESISQQTFPKERISCVVVENGSIDNTAQLVQEFPSNFELVLHQEPNRTGASRARNKGIEIAVQEFNPDIFITCDADTEMSPNLTQKVYDTIKRGYLGGTTKVIYDSPKLSAKAQQMIINFVSRGWHDIIHAPFPAYVPLLFFNRTFVKKQLKEKGYVWDPKIELGEEVAIQKDMARIGNTKYIPNAYTTTSMRRWERQGNLKIFVSGILGQFYKGGKWPVEDRS